MMNWLSGVVSYWQTRVSTIGASARSGKRMAMYDRTISTLSGSMIRSPSVGSNGGP